MRLLAASTALLHRQRTALPAKEARFHNITEEHVFGDPGAMVHVSQTPRSPHGTYVDSALASDVRQGEPVRINPSRAFAFDDVVKPWVKVEDVCSPLDVLWNYYAPSGTLVHSDEQTLDPADQGRPCLSSFSTAGWTTLRQNTFGEGGQYTVELWLGGQHTANHAFRMEGPGPLAPYVHNDFFEMDEDAVLDGDAGSVLANDLDPNMDPLTVSLIEPPAHGTLDLAGDGTFAYTPDPDYYGVDSFDYTATDPGGLEDVAGVTILVNPINDPPLVADDTFNLVLPEEETSVTVPAPGVLLNDRDPDHEPLEVALIDPPPMPGLTLRPDGEIVIDGAEAWIGEPDGYSFTYVVRDPSGLETIGEATVRVTRSP